MPISVLTFSVIFPLLSSDVFLKCYYNFVECTLKVLQVLRVLRSRIRSIIYWRLRRHYKDCVLTLLRLIQLQQSCVLR